MTVPDRYTCEEMFRKLDAYLDRALTPEEASLIERHLATCASCASHYGFEESLLAQIRQKLRRVDLPASVLDRIVGRLAEAGTPPGEGEDPSAGS